MAKKETDIFEDIIEEIETTIEKLFKLDLESRFCEAIRQVAHKYQEDEYIMEFITAYVVHTYDVDLTFNN